MGVGLPLFVGGRGLGADGGAREVEAMSKLIALDTADLQLCVEISVRANPKRLAELKEAAAQALEQRARELEACVWRGAVKAVAP